MGITRREAILGGAGLVLGAAAMPVSRAVGPKLFGGAAPTAALTTHYAGLIGIVRTETGNTGPYADLGYVKALLVDAQAATAGTSINIGEHVPLLRIRIALVQNSQDFLAHTDGSFFKIPLKGQIVSYWLDGNSTDKEKVSATVRSGDTADYKYCPKDDEWKEVNWLPNMDLIMKPGYAKKVRPAYLNSDPKNTPVASRIARSVQAG